MAAVLSPVSPGFPSPTLYNLYSQKAGRSHHLPHTAVYKEERSHQASKRNNTKNDHSTSLVSIFSTLLEAKVSNLDTILKNSVSADQESSLTRTDTLPTCEVPSTTIPNDFNKSGLCPSQEVPHIAKEYRLQKLTLTQANISKLKQTHPSVVPSLANLLKHTWKVTIPTINQLTSIWTKHNPQDESNTTLEPITSNKEPVSKTTNINLSLSYALTNKDIISATLTILSITDEAYELLTSAPPTNLPSIPSNVLKLTLQVLRTPDIKSPFLREGVIETRSMTSYTSQDVDSDVVPEGMVWWVPSFAKDDEEDSDADEKEDEDNEDEDEDIDLRLRTALIPDDTPLLEEIYDQIYWCVS